MPLREVKLTPVAGEKAKAAGTKLGGKPDWLQGEWKPVCCDQPMTFLGQLDSLDLQNAALPDSAMVYVFVCEKCCSTVSQMQFF